MSIDISDAIKEYEALYEAQIRQPDIDIISFAELMTLSRYCNDNKYEKLAKTMGMKEEPLVVAGYASVEVIDKQGHLITVGALKKAFKKFMKNFRTRNGIVMHTDTQVGWIIPAYINKDGRVVKSEVTDKGLFVVSEISPAGRIVDRVRKEIKDGNIRSYSIAGVAINKEPVKKAGGGKFLKVTDLELSEISFVENPANQKAHFKLVKEDNVYGSGKKSGEIITLDAAMSLFPKKTITLSDYSVCLVGGLVNIGKSENDVDVAVRADKGSWLSEAIRVRLARGVDPDQRKRLSFIETLGPHNDFIPLYKLQLVPHEKFGMISKISGEVIRKAYNSYGNINEPQITDMAALLKYISGNSVLELGCGAGNFMKILRDSGYEACGIDNDDNVIKDAQEDGMDIKICDLNEKLPYEDNSFDNVVSMHVMEHLDNMKEALKESERVSRGNVAHIVPLGKRLCDDHKSVWYSIDDLKEHFPSWNVEEIDGSDRNAVIYRGNVKDKCRGYLELAKMIKSNIKPFKEQGIISKTAPGPPPRPGLEWYEETKRWRKIKDVRPSITDFKTSIGSLNKKNMGKVVETWRDEASNIKHMHPEHKKTINERMHFLDMISDVAHGIEGTEGEKTISLEANGNIQAAAAYKMSKHTIGKVLSITAFASAPWNIKGIKHPDNISKSGTTLLVNIVLEALKDPDVKSIRLSPSKDAYDWYKKLGFKDVPNSELIELPIKNIRDAIRNKREKINKSAPGPPPRPGLIWYEPTKRWRKPKDVKSYQHIQNITGKYVREIVNESDFPKEASRYMRFLGSYSRIAHEKVSDEEINSCFKDAKESVDNSLDSYKKHLGIVRPQKEEAEFYETIIKPEITRIIDLFDNAKDRFDKVHAIETLANAMHEQEIWSPLLFGILDYNDPSVGYGAIILNHLADNKDEK